MSKLKKHRVHFWGGYVTYVDALDRGDALNRILQQKNYDGSDVDKKQVRKIERCRK